MAEKTGEHPGGAWISRAVGLVGPGKEAEGFVLEKVMGDTEGEIGRKDQGEREGKHFKAKENQRTPFCPLLCPAKWNASCGNKVIAWSPVPLFLK